MSEVMYALVVDDEPAIRRLIVKALTERRFRCNEAGDGEQALQALGRRKYDVVITDLRMPKRNGHSLAAELVQWGSDRPLIVVFTGVLEPRLAADLIARGVDDIAFKPLDFDLFGAKVRALCERRHRENSFQGHAVRPANGGSPRSSPRCTPPSRELVPITIGQIEQGLDEIAGSLPVSHAAIEVVNIIQNGIPAVEEIARSIARDPLLTVEVLRLANSAHHNPAGKRIDDLQEAILRVGDRRICELALAATTISALTRSALDWVDADLVWKRSLAAGLAIEQLHAAAGVGADEEGLFLSSLLLPMGRVLLGLAFPDVYQGMVAHCQQTGSSLASLERCFLPISPARALAWMLEHWHLSPRLCKPLEHSGLLYHELAILTEPLRSKVERLRVAEFLGQLAINRFNSWDEIEFPLAETTRRLGASDLESIVNHVRAGLAQLHEGALGPESSPVCATGINRRDRAQIRYISLTAETPDLLEVFLQTLNMTVIHVGAEAAHEPQPVLINGLDASNERQEGFLQDAGLESPCTLICRGPVSDRAGGRVEAVYSPSSFKHLSDAIMTAATDTASCPVSCRMAHEPAEA